jgi:Spy/CpxP family protein refolding chaperone
MRNNFRTVFTTTIVLATFTAAATLYAHAADSQTPPNAPGMGSMMQGGHGDMSGMMNMMGQMSQMMENCNNMMKDMNQRRGTEMPKAEKNPAQKR